MGRGASLRAASSVALTLARSLALVALYAPVLAISAGLGYRRMCSGFRKTLKRGGIPEELRREMTSRFEEATSPTALLSSLLRGLSLGSRFYGLPGSVTGVEDERGR